MVLSLKTESQEYHAKDPAASSPLREKGTPSRSVSIYDFISTTPDGVDSSNQQESGAAHRTPRPKSAARNYEVVEDTRDILSARQQSTAFNNANRQLFQADVHHNADGSERFKPEYEARGLPAPDHHPVGTDYQSRYRRRMQQNTAAGGVADQRRSQGNGRVSDFPDFQDDIVFDNESYYPTYYSQHESYRLPPQTRFAAFHAKGKGKIDFDNRDVVCTPENRGGKACVEHSSSLETVENRHIEKQGEHFIIR